MALRDAAAAQGQIRHIRVSARYCGSGATPLDIKNLSGLDYKFRTWMKTSWGVAFAMQGCMSGSHQQSGCYLRP